MSLGATGSATGSARYLTLDGLRGLAAIAVALFHFDHKLMAGGYLAVDLFFVLSGFVLIRTYGDSFARRDSWVAFMRKRLIRLYPLFAVGIVLSVLHGLQGTWRQADNAGTLGDLAATQAFNLFMLPSPVSTALFPYNPPAWSLFFELLANVLLILFLARLGKRGLGLVCVLAALALGGVLVVIDGSALGAEFAAIGQSVMALGADWDGWLVAALRTLFSFSVGVLLGRLHVRPDRPPGPLALVPLMVLGLCLWLPFGAGARLAFDFAFVAVISPLLIVAGSSIEPSRRLAPESALIGEVSYALYAIHSPVAHGFQWLTRALGVPVWQMAPAYLLVALILAWLSVRLIDMPARRWLNRRFASRQGEPVHVPWRA